MGLSDYLKILRTRWITVLITALITIVGAIAFTLLQVPLYEAKTRLFVSAVGGTSVTETYSGNRLSQERVLSYTQLIVGDTVAQRTIDRLNLEMEPGQLTKNIRARSRPNTVLIDVSVLDESPVRARDIANALSDEFVELISELETSSPGKPPDARVVVEQRASVPTKPVAPKKARNLALGIALGAMLGMGLAVLRDQLDNTVKDRQTLESLTGVGVVGSVPNDKPLRDDHLVSFDSGRSASAEAFRRLRTNLNFLSVDHPPRLLVIASPSPNEGKSTIAINLALALAEAGQNVVVVDGDMRRPSIDSYLGIVRSVGLSSVLSGAITLSDALQRTKFPRLTALAAGSTPPNPSELLGSLAARRVLTELRDQFDYVIVDSAPLLAVTDTALLAANSDGALVVARYGRTKYEQLAHAISTLHDVGAGVLGAILTMEPIKKAGYYYYYDGGSEEKPSRASDGQFNLEDSQTSDNRLMSDLDRSSTPKGIEI